MKVAIRWDEVVKKYYTRRAYLLIKACAAGADIFTAIEAVSSTALAHPEWDLEEKKTYKEWEEEGK